MKRINWARAHLAAAAPILVAIAVALLVSLIALACSRPAPPQSEAARLAAESNAAGATIFTENCAVCHTLPILQSLFEQNRGRPPGFVYDALTRGNMRRVGSRLDDASRRAVAEFFTGVAFDSPQAKRSFEVSPRCEPDRSLFDWQDLAYPAWGRSPRNPRALPDGAGPSKDAVGRLAVAWVIAFPESSQLRSQPTAAGGALFVGSHNGSVYALDQATGCTRWHFKAATEVRTAVTIDVEPNRTEAAANGRPTVRAVFADRAANVYAVDAESGRLLWRRSVDPHVNAAITGSVTAHAGRLYVPVSSNDDVNSMDPSYPCCTHSGAVVALDARTGRILWRRPTIDEAPTRTGETTIGTAIRGPSGASVWNTPTISVEHGLLFVGSGNNHSRPATAMSDSVLALSLSDGRVRWVYQAQSGDAWNAACLYGTRSSCPDPEGPDIDFGATTMLVRSRERDLLVAGQKSGLLHALDPATGALVWKERIVSGGPNAGIRYGMANRTGVLFVPAAGRALDARFGGHEREAGGGLHAISANDGEILWTASASEFCADPTSCDPTFLAPPLATSEVVFAARLDGVVHAFERESGRMLWRFATAREFETRLGQRTRGGGISGTAGPIYANGRLFVSSGYGQAQLPGNALIAFE